MIDWFQHIIIAIILLTVTCCETQKPEPGVLPNSIEYLPDSSKVTVNFKGTTGKVKVIQKFGYHTMLTEELEDTVDTIVFYARYQGTYFVVVEDSLVGKVQVH